MQQARQHLQRGRLARAVRADEADDLTRLDREADVAHGFDGIVSAAHKTAHGGAQPGPAHGNLVRLDEVVDLNL